MSGTQQVGMGYGVADSEGRAEIDRLTDLARQAHLDYDYAARRRHLNAADAIRTGRTDS